jgi:iron(III) transport system permease protein
LLTLLPPVLGILRPLAGRKTNQVLKMMVSALSGTAGTTVLYCVTAGLTAACLGFFAALCAARSANARRWLMILAGCFLAIPPSLNALGLVSLTTRLPAQLDGLSRGGWIVGLGQGLRLMPLAAALCLSGWCKIPRSCHEAAACHGLGAFWYVLRVGLPQILPMFLAAFVIVGLLAAADVPSTMLLAPPGRITLPGKLFTVMDNASEQLVASLCLTYLTAGLIAAAVLCFVCRRHWRCVI